ncbi:MAG: hypothetical protein ABJC39_12955 [Chloroflexota bacterium]
MPTTIYPLIVVTGGHVWLNGLGVHWSSPTDASQIVGVRPRAAGG